MHGVGTRAVQAPCLFARLRMEPRRSRFRTRGRARASSWVRASGTDDVKMGVVIVDHGSRRQASNDLLGEFVRMYKEQTGRPIVELAHMEIAEPNIETAFAKCVEQGATMVAVSPFFLSPGRHWQEDIPHLARRGEAPGSGTLRSRANRTTPADGRYRGLAFGNVLEKTHRGRCVCLYRRSFLSRRTKCAAPDQP